MLMHSNGALTADRQAAAAATLAQAFAKDPFMTYVLPDPETRVQRLARAFLSVLRCCQHYGGLEIAHDGGGVLAWLPGTAFAWPTKMLAAIRSGLIWLPRSVGLSAFNRFLAHDSACERALVQNAPKDFAYLWVVGVHPSHAGRGLGKQMIQTALEDMRRRGHSACLLRTENPKNVGLYEHLGFRQVLTETPPDSGIQFWLMSQDL